jgi:hypothetical protein
MDIQKLRNEYSNRLEELYTDPKYAAHPDEIWMLSNFMANGTFKMRWTQMSNDVLCKLGQDNRLNYTQIDWLIKEFLF